ncbi:MAG: hypothetical protein HY331_00950 [Chloroflexi bacterium]|nr:hypothetical protein [Chloroflexota bacterium]
MTHEVDRMAMQVANRAIGFWQLVREVNVENIRREAEQPFLLGVVAPAPARTAIVDALTEGAESRGRRSIYAADPRWRPEDESVLRRANAIVAYVAADDGETVARLAGPSRSPVLLVFPAGAAPAIGLPAGASPLWRETSIAGLARPEIQRRLIPETLKLVPELALALGSALPAFRGAARQTVIGEVSLANAKLAALSNIPAVIPVVGGLLGAAGDFVMLTKNQIMLLYKLAAIHDRNTGQGLRLIAEVAPIIGAAFLWRSIARELVGLLPFLVGAVPKVLIAYTGTFVVGEMAAFYYATGERPTRDLMDRWYRQAIERVRLGLPAFVTGRALRPTDEASAREG